MIFVAVLASPIDWRMKSKWSVGEELNSLQFTLCWVMGYPPSFFNSSPSIHKSIKTNTKINQQWKKNEVKESKDEMEGEQMEVSWERKHITIHPAIKELKILYGGSSEKTTICSIPFHSTSQIIFFSFILEWKKYYNSK